MKKFLVIAFLGLMGMALRFASCTSSTPTATAIDRTKAIAAGHISTFKRYVSDSLLPATQQRAGLPLLRRRFLQTRLLYKKIEWATEYFMGFTTRWVNGAPLPEVEVEENKITAPEGLQVIEAMLYPQPDSLDYPELERQVRLLRSRCAYYESYWRDLGIDSAQVFDAARLQVFRVITLGITGFDASLAKSSLPEAAASLQAVGEVMAVFGNDLKPSFARANDYLIANTDFDAFDRAAFIKGYTEPLSKGIVALQRKLDVPFVKDDRLLRPSAASLFAKDAFNVNAYTQDSTYWSSPAKVALGKALFYDNSLSENNSRSCATCHQPTKAFTDGLAVSAGLSGHTIQRNAPTLLNAALQPSQFYDMRTTNLENQSRDVIQNRAEMHGDLSAALIKLKSNSRYDSLLRTAFPRVAAFTEQHLQNALASYVRSLTLLNSRFDAYMRDEGELTADERSGFNLFMGKAKCGTCHFMPLFNGTVPPGFLKIESEVIGVSSRKNQGVVDEDLGRYAVHQLAPFKHAFKTTTVRNSALTAPYMHNGVYKTLNQVIDFYDRGGGIGLGFELTNQTLPPDKLNLSATEKAGLIAFLQSLSDRVSN